MHTHFVDFTSEGVNYELDFMWLYLLYYLLDHMISISIFHTEIDQRLHFFYQVILLCSSNYF